MASVPLVARAGDVYDDTDLNDDIEAASAESLLLRRKPKCWNLLAAAGLVVASLAMLLLLVSVLMPSASLANSAIVQHARVSDTINLHAKSPAAPMEVVFVLGGPGAGKGTQCDNIVRYFKWAHLSMGDLLRTEVQKGGPLADEISDAMKNGKLVPGEVTAKLLKAEMARQAEVGNHRFLIDGFPRNRENLVDWENFIGPVDPSNSTIMYNATVIHHKKHGHPELAPFATVKFVLFFDLDEKTMLTRCLHRGETSGRPDDNEESVKKRFVTYNEETKPILEALDKMGLVRTISSVPDEDHVFKSVAPLFKGSERRTPLPPPTSTVPTPTNHSTASDVAAHQPEHPAMQLLFNAWAKQNPDIMHRRIVYGCPNV